MKVYNLALIMEVCGGAGSKRRNGPKMGMEQWVVGPERRGIRRKEKGI